MPPEVAVIAGGVGAAKFLAGLVADIGGEPVTAIVNVAGRSSDGASGV